MNENEIRGYLDSDGRVTLMPPKRKKKLLVLAYLADRIPPACLEKSIPHCGIMRDCRRESVKPSSNI